MNKKILLIDDLRSFKDHPTGYDIYTARNSDEGIRMILAFSAFDEVWWDHDLGGDDTTLIVADWLLKESIVNNRKFSIDLNYIHTSNPAGAVHLRETLESRFLGYTCVRVGQEDSNNVFSVAE